MPSTCQWHHTIHQLMPAAVPLFTVSWWERTTYTLWCCAEATSNSRSIGICQQIRRIIAGASILQSDIIPFLPCARATPVHRSTIPTTPAGYRVKTMGSVLVPVAWATSTITILPQTRVILWAFAFPTQFGCPSVSTTVSDRHCWLIINIIIYYLIVLVDAWK